MRALDGLRGLAIAPVVWHHATPRPLEGLLGRGPLGVDLFFTLSGYLVTSLLLAERARRGGIDLPAFWARRAARILPLYYLVLGAFAAGTSLLLEPASPSRQHFERSLAAYATFTTTWFVDFSVPHPIVFAFSWSLAPEVQFYLLFPPLLLVLGGGRARAAPMVAILLALQPVAAGWLPAASPGSVAAVARAFAEFPRSLLLGALGAAMTFGAPGRQLVESVATLLLPVALAALGFAVAADGTPLLAVHAAMLAVVVVAAVGGRDGAGSRLLSLRPLVRLGELSYGVYLLHVGVLGALRWLVPSRAGDAPFLFALGLPLAAAAASVSARVVERPVVEWAGRWLAARRAPSR